LIKQISDKNTIMLCSRSLIELGERDWCVVRRDGACVHSPHSVQYFTYIDLSMIIINLIGDMSVWVVLNSCASRIGRAGGEMAGAQGPALHQQYSYVNVM